jgi:APA family basic amino acid/polyamine antiporter
VVAVIGFIGIFAILVFTLITHPIGRIAGPAWIALGIILYFVYRLRKRLPLFRSRKRDWRSEQIEILRRAGELELMDEYVANVRASDERRAAGAG